MTDRSQARWPVAAAALAGAALAVLPSPGRGPPEPRAAPPVVVVAQSRPAQRPQGPRAVATAFLAAYEGFVYGRGTAEQLPGVSAAVRRALAAQRPEPAPAVVAAAGPRLRSLTLTAAGPARRRVAAVIVDGASRYELDLTLTRRRGQWTIVGLGETG